MKDSIIVVASLKIAPGKKDEAESIWRSLISNIEETEEGKIVYEVFHHKTHDDGAEEYCLVEEWASQAVLEAWAVKPIHAEAQKQMMDHLIVEGSLDTKFVKRFSGTKR